MRSPITLWRFMNIARPGPAGRACPGSRRGSPTLPTSCSSAARRVSSTCSAGSPRLAGGAAASSATCSRWVDERPRPARRAPAGARPGPRSGRPPGGALVGVEPLVGPCSACSSVTPARMRVEPSEQPIANPWPCSLSAAWRRRAVLAVSADVCDDELVAADPVGAAAVADRDRRAGGPAGSAARRRRDGRSVVVGLEAVEVEDRRR